MNGQNCGSVIVWAGQGELHFGPGQFCGNLRSLCRQLLGEAIIAILDAQVGQFPQVGHLRLQVAPQVYRLLELAQLLHFALGVGRVVPKVSCGRLAVQFCD